MKYCTGLVPSDRAFIIMNLPNEILRHGSVRELSASYDASKKRYSIWYGEIITGNYVAEHHDLRIAVRRMLDYIRNYKDMDEVTFMSLGIKKGICLHCKHPLVKEDALWYHCPECKLCYQKTGWVAKIQWRLWKHVLKRLLSKP